MPDEIQPKLSQVINAISEKPELDNYFSTVIRNIYDLAPPYTYFHYRLLHKEVQNSAKTHYIAKDYYSAFQEAMKRYKNAFKDKSGVTASEDKDRVANAFGKDSASPVNLYLRYGFLPLKVSLEDIEKHKIKTSKSTRIDPSYHVIMYLPKDAVLYDILKKISMGIVSGGRNIVSHEEHRDLMNSGLFTEKDCLDLLGLLSHLFKRLDESDKRT